MHTLDRSVAAAPACLGAYDYQTHTWEDLDSACKRQLRFALFQMQGIPGVVSEDAKEYGLRCAYCESAIRHEGHIEHFRRKNPHHFPQFTFDWNNLFLACGSRKHCGHYKDRKGAAAYDANDIIKPDQDDPEHYLYFHSNGEVRERSELNATDAHRACETIRVFGLDDGALAGARRAALKSYRNKILSDLAELESWAPPDRALYFAAEIEATRWDPHATTIKHFLQTLL